MASIRLATGTLQQCSPVAMVWSKVWSRSAPQPSGTSNDLVSILRTWLPLHGWEVADRPSFPGNNNYALLAYPFTDWATGQTHTLRYWIEYETSAWGYEIYADITYDTSPGTSTTSDGMVANNSWSSNDLCIWTSDQAPNALMLTAGTSLLWFWPGFTSGFIPGNNVPAKMGYPMPWNHDTTSSDRCIWFGPPMSNGHDSAAYLQHPGFNTSNQVSQTDFSHPAFLMQGWTLGARQSSGSLFQQFTQINSPDILLYLNRIRISASSFGVIPNSTAVPYLTTKFDGTNYYIALHPGLENDGTSVWLDCGTSEPTFTAD